MKVIPKSIERLFKNTRKMADFFPDFKIHDFKSTTSIPTDIQNSEKTSSWNHKSEGRNTVTDTKYSTFMRSENLPDQLELPSIEKLCITQNYDPSGNPKTENSTIETPKNVAKAVRNNEKPKAIRRLTFKATPACSNDLKGFDQIFERRIKSEEKNDITKETSRRELLIAHQTPPFKNYRFENSPELYREKNYEPQVGCRIDKAVLKNLMKSHSIKYHPNEDHINRFFRIEVAFYVYLEQHVFRSSRLDRCTLFTFAWHVYNLEPSLRIYLDNLSNFYSNWKKYKYSLPTYGAAILSEDASHVVMVQSSICKNSWGFPKGKVIPKEDPVSCAVREVREEIGLDIQHLIREDNYIEYKDYKGSTFGLYIIEGIPRSTKFTTKCKYEIKAIEWKPIEDLVTYGGKFLMNIVSKNFIPKLKDKKIIPKELHES